MTLTRDIHYAAVERWRRAALAYRRRHRAGYFDDLVRLLLHPALGLGVTLGGDDGNAQDRVAVLASLTPVREREVLLVAPALTPSFRQTLGRVVIDLFVRRLGVMAFNVGLLLPPLAPPLGLSRREDWSGFPVIARVVDRGNPLAQNSDVGGMELFSQGVVSADPFALADALQEVLA
jgi:hypothetical protein